MATAPLVAGWSATRGTRWPAWSPPPAASGPVPAVTAAPVVAAWPSRTILDISVELQLSPTAGEWLDMVAAGFVYARDQIDITRGRSDEAGLAEPSSAKVTFNNRDGRFSPRNPRGAYYGLIGRNTPLRVNVRPHLTAGPVADLTDTFGREVGDTNWGIADTGQSWAATGTDHAAAQYAVTGGVGVLKMIRRNVTTGSWLPDASWTEFDATVTVTVPQVTTSGTPSAEYILAGLASHVTATATGIYAELRCYADGSAQVYAFTGAAVQLGHAFVLNAGFHTGQPLKLRVLTAGLSMQIKAWDASVAEPDDWSLIAVGTTAYDPGSLYAFVKATTNTTNALPISVTFDNLTVEAIEPRVTGEVSTWPPRWDTTGSDVWTQVEAAGILRRLSQGTPTARSSLVRFIQAQTTPPVAYWPLDDGQLATAGTPLYGSHNMDLYPTSAVAAQQSFGQGTLAPWLANGVAINWVELTGDVNMTSTLTTWAVDWVRAGSESSAESTMIIRTTTEQWEVRFNPSTSLVKVVNPSSVTTSASAGTTFDGAMHHVRFLVQDSAGTMSWTVYIDGTSRLTNTFAHAIEPIMYVDFQDLLTHTTDFAMGHISVWVNTIPILADTVTAVFGHLNETAGDRLVRLCAEDDIALRIPGPVGQSLARTTAMGVQSTQSTLDLIRECEASDGGVLYEPRDFLGLEYQPRFALQAQAPALTLDYTADGNLAPPLEPTDDDQRTRNDVTVNRKFGASARVQQTTGPLSISAPPDGVGQYDTTVDLSLAADSQVTNQASWRVHLGTVDESRYPRINLNLANTAVHAQQILLGQAIRANVGDRAVITNPPAWLPPGQISQLIQGFAETLDQYTWDLGLVAAPASPWAIATVESNDEFCFRAETDGSTLNGDHTSSATSLSVSSSGIVWTTTADYPADFPFDVNIAGVRITVTAIAGATSPQTFTVIRSVDGFDLALDSGSAVTLWRPVYLALD